MAYQFPPDVQDQLRQHMATGQYATEEDVLRNALRALKLQDEDVTAIRDAIADMEAGDRGKPFDEFAEEFRRKHKIPQDV